MSVDFSQLAPPKMIETIDYEAILSERKQALIARFDIDKQDAIKALLERESEPLTKFIEENAYREMVLRNRINQAAKACLLAYATGSDLDHLAANFNMVRLISRPATDTTEAVYESDEIFRLRVQKAFDRLSVAGPQSAYKYHCLSADGRVADVTVVSPRPAEVVITVLQGDSQTGQASDELLEIVRKAVNDEAVRPIGDRVTVQSASIHRYSVQAKLFISQDPQSATVLANAIARLESYTKESARLGRSIRLSAIYACLHIAGVSRVQIVHPTQDIVLSSNQAGYCTGIDVSIGGIE